eukprot:TRINITY_DN6709_c0_g1_i2.p1 TRINITY_DN6709_c0_g1~~TRINITY_DN6709_c0_g1_i2.p1  ORF type:complete len:447 (+),score=38.96 TRINITY_DN6709_c0_g1_i2:503-1843(+)
MSCSQEPEIAIISDLIQLEIDDGFAIVTKNKPKLKKKTKKKAKKQINNSLLTPQQQIIPTAIQDSIDYLTLTHRIFTQKITTDLDKKVNQLVNDSNQLSSLKMLIIQRLRFLVIQLNSQLTISLFGSLVTGLSLPTSDIDINIIDNSGMQNPEQVLKMLMEILQKQKWIKQYKGIFTASVPVLKLKVDPLEPFNSGCPFIDWSFNTVEIYTENIEINVDITMQSLYCNLSYQYQQQLLQTMGELSTELVNTWLAQYPPLFSLIIFFKDILAKNLWNNSYKGGFSSFSIAIIIVAFLRYKGLTNCLNYCEIISQFCYFFGFEFNPNQIGICLSMPNPFISLDKIQHPNCDPPKLFIVDPLNESNNITKNSYQTIQIFKKFADIYSNLQKYKFELKELLQNLKLSPKLIDNAQSEQELIKLLATQYQPFAEFYSKDIFEVSSQCNKLL